MTKAKTGRPRSLDRAAFAHALAWSGDQAHAAKVAGSKNVTREGLRTKCVMLLREKPVREALRAELVTWREAATAVVTSAIEEHGRAYLPAMATTLDVSQDEASRAVRAILLCTSIVSSEGEGWMAADKRSATSIARSMADPARRGATVVENADGALRLALAVAVSAGCAADSPFTKRWATSWLQTTHAARIARAVSSVAASTT